MKTVICQTLATVMHLHNPVNRSQSFQLIALSLPLSFSLSFLLTLYLLFLQQCSVSGLHKHMRTCAITELEIQIPEQTGKMKRRKKIKRESLILIRRRHLRASVLCVKRPSLDEAD